MDYTLSLELALPYIAGIIDGEGCITISKRGQPLLRLSMYDREPMDIIAHTFGGSVNRMKRSDGKPVWQLTYTSQSAVDVAYTIGPWLLVKKAEADLLVEYYKDFTSYKGGDHAKIPQEEWDKRTYYYNRMQELVKGHKKR